MAEFTSNNQLSSFMNSGIYKLAKEQVVFVDPVRILNRSYTRFRVSPSAYYSRFFNSSVNLTPENQNDSLQNPKKRKRGKKSRKTPKSLNLKEQIADQRHQDVRLHLLKAHETLLKATELLEILGSLSDGQNNDKESVVHNNEIDFVELGRVWQAPLYEMLLQVKEDSTLGEIAGLDTCKERAVPAFDNLVANEENNDAVAILLEHKYILPKKSCFFMSDLNQIHNMVPVDSDLGFNLIMIDPPWENSSAHQKMKYQTLPNRHFLSLPIKQLTHTDGALVALWVTNREKLRNFVETELFPKWGIKHAATFHWLKVKSDGSLISELDLFHHRPYECLLLGYSHRNETQTDQLQKLVPDNKVFISVPGDYSRKPPIGELLMDYVPGFKPARSVELFSREMLAGWTSWGNEPLHFQDSLYFICK